MLVFSALWCGCTRWRGVNKTWEILPWATNAHSTHHDAGQKGHTENLEEHLCNSPSMWESVTYILPPPLDQVQRTTINWILARDDVSNSYAFGPYSRQVNSIMVPAAGTASGSVPSFTGISPSSSNASIPTTSDLFASTSNIPSNSEESIITSSRSSASGSTSNSSPILTGGLSSFSLGGSSLSSSSTSSSGNSANSKPPPSTTTFSTGAAIVPITIKATDGSQHSIGMLLHLRVQPFTNML